MVDYADCIWVCDLSEDLSFESALQRLEVIVAKLEAGNVSLEEAISLYEEGCKLQKMCEIKLDSAKVKIDEIKKKNDSQKSCEESD